jgi:hypothetical protein
MRLVRSSKRFASNANLDELAQRYAGAQAAIEATSNYYHIYDTLSEHLDVTVAHPKELNQIADTDKSCVEYFTLQGLYRDPHGVTLVRS